jgi:hypothetical protein
LLISEDFAYSFSKFSDDIAIALTCENLLKVVSGIELNEMKNETSDLYSLLESYNQDVYIYGLHSRYEPRFQNQSVYYGNIALSQFTFTGALHSVLTKDKNINSLNALELYLHNYFNSVIHFSDMEPSMISYMRNEILREFCDKMKSYTEMQEHELQTSIKDFIHQIYRFRRSAVDFRMIEK